ncbi:MAG: hypothetical protein QM755_23915 [Luteolibacter sp.]
MSKPANHACFEAATADLLGRLYEAFPAPLKIHYETAFKEASLIGQMPDHCATAFSGRTSLYGATVEFLMREGIVHASKTDSFNAEGLVLTSKGFVLLQQPVPDSNQKDGVKTLGDAFKELGGLIYGSLVTHAMDYFWQKITGT